MSVKLTYLSNMQSKQSTLQYGAFWFKGSSNSGYEWIQSHHNLHISAR